MANSGSPLPVDRVSLFGSQILQVGIGGGMIQLVGSCSQHEHFA